MSYYTMYIYILQTLLIGTVVLFQVWPIENC